MDKRKLYQKKVEYSKRGFLIVELARDSKEGFIHPLPKKGRRMGPIMVHMDYLLGIYLVVLE